MSNMNRRAILAGLPAITLPTTAIVPTLAGSELLSLGAQFDRAVAELRAYESIFNPAYENNVPAAPAEAARTSPLNEKGRYFR